MKEEREHGENIARLAFACDFLRAELCCLGGSDLRADPVVAFSVVSLTFDV